MKKSKLLVTALLGVLAVSAAGCLFSFVYVSWQDLSRQSRWRAARDFAQQEKAAQALEREYRDWRELPLRLQEFRRDNIFTMDQFAAFRRDLDSRLAACGLRPPRIDLNFGGIRGNIRKVTLKFSAEGSYRDVKKFIHGMETKTKMHYFSSVHLTPGAETVKGAFLLEVYLGE